MEFKMTLPDWNAVVEVANTDPETLLALKNAQFCAAVKFGDERVLLEVGGGAVRVSAESATADFEVRAPESAWTEYAAGRKVHTNSIMSMARQGHLSKDGRVRSEFEFDGDQRKLWANFRVLDLVLQQLRSQRG
jgi:hypothetical protein